MGGQPCKCSGSSESAPWHALSIGARLSGLTTTTPPFPPMFAFLQQTQQSRDDGGGPSESATPSDDLMQTQLPVDALEDAHQHLSIGIRPEFDDIKIRQNLGLIRYIVCRVLERRKELATRLAEENKFIENMKWRGEKDFIKSLKTMAEHAKAGNGNPMAWAELFNDGTLFSSFDLSRLIISI